MIALRHVATPLEHHVLEEMRETRLAGLLVAGAHVVRHDTPRR